MNEQTQDHFEKLDEVRLALSLALMADKGDERTIRRGVVDASQILEETTGLLRADHAKMARARDAAVKLLTKLRDNRFQPPTSVPFRVGLIDPLAPHPYSERRRQDREACANVIALLQGGEDDE